MITQTDWQSLYTPQLASVLNARFGSGGLSPDQLHGFIQDVLDEALEDKILSRAADRAENDPRNQSTTISHKAAWAAWAD
jgi:hypothetical protein